MNRSYPLAALAFLGLLLSGCDSSPAGETPAPAASSVRPAQWATPIEGHAGLPNFHRVSDALYRGAQPEDEGFAELKELGIQTVVNLRSLHSDRSECEENELDYVKISAQAWDAEEDEVVDFLRVVTDPARLPVFVHCQHGADRTGMMVAVYRVVEQGWTKEDAIQEMTEGGFGYHSIWKELVEYVRDLDVEALRRQVEAAQ